MPEDKLNKLEVYIGDGVYGEYDGIIRLYTMEGAEIYLEPEVLKALIHWAKTFWPTQVTGS